MSSALIEADYVIVGGGSAGCVLANRLSANPATEVVLIEAGGESDSALVKMPAGMARLIANPKHDWCYVTERDASIAGRRFIWSAGRMLGGGSAINGQVHIRGLRSDYDRWAREGCTGWSFDELLPYFARCEVTASPVRSPHPLLETFLAGCNELGLATLADYCAGQQHGVFRTLATQRDGLRCSSARAHLEPVRTRPNLRVLTQCLAQRVLLRDGRATGVSVRRAQATLEILARAEVLLCAGTVGSPAVLMRSGIGDGAPLQAQGIAVAVDAPQVGRNVQEHPGVAIARRVRVPTYNSAGTLKILSEALRFAMQRRGMLTTPAVQAMAFVKTRDELADPDVQLHFLPLAYEVTPDTLCSATATMPKVPAMMVMSNVCRPQTRGQIRLASPDAAVPPTISHPLLGDARDVQTLVRACRFVEQLFATRALREVVTGRLFPPQIPADDAGWEDYVRNKAVPCYHPVGSCRMGADAQSVVDPALRVRGVERLRVADASVMPYLISANTNAATMMIAEKAADLILRPASVARVAVTVPEHA